LVKLPSGAAETHGDAESHGHIHMPSPSYWPLVFAIGLPILGYGFVFKNWYILAAGVVWLMFGMTGWATEPATEEAQ